VSRPDDQRRTLQLAAGGTVCIVVGPVDTEARPVVLKHRAHDRRIVDRSLEVGVVLRAHRRLPFRAGPVPGVRVSEDSPLGQLGLGEEEPVPPLLCEAGVGTGQGLADWHGVEDYQPAHGIGVVHGKAEGDVAAAIVANHCELFRTKMGQQR